MLTENKSYTYREIRKKYKNAYEKWTLEADIKLEVLYRNGKSIGELAALFGRNKNAVTTRLKKINLSCAPFEDSEEFNIRWKCHQCNTVRDKWIKKQILSNNLLGKYFYCDDCVIEFCIDDIDIEWCDNRGDFRTVKLAKKKAYAEEKVEKIDKTLSKPYGERLNDYFTKGN